MKRQIWTMIGLSSAIALAIVPLAFAAGKARPAPQVQAGRDLAQTHCSACHAVGRTGASPNRQAPRFVTLSKRYPLDNLAEALSEGILVGHGPMPAFEFEPDQIDALIAYLKSIQPPAKPRRQPAAP